MLVATLLFVEGNWRGESDFYRPSNGASGETRVRLEFDLIRGGSDAGWS